MREPDAGVIQVWSDLLCPFAYLALHGLRVARTALPSGDPAAQVRLEHHVFALELFDGPHRRRGTDAEAAGLGQLAPATGLRIWAAADDLYPHTVLLAAEVTRSGTTAELDTASLAAARIPIVDRHDPSVYGDLLRRATGTSAG